jgi:hypothetical protein
MQSHMICGAARQLRKKPRAVLESMYRATVVLATSLISACVIEYVCTDSHRDNF